MHWLRLEGFVILNSLTIVIIRKMSVLTIFTPTFNRAETLKRTYESLRAQTSSDFIWLIIDDGSVDNTKELVDKWIEANNKFSIEYIYKENGGLHTGYNTAIANIRTELCVCCDSDDYMPDNAVEIIIRTWRNRPEGNFAGIIGLDYDARTGQPIGGFFSEVTKPLHLLELESKIGHSGDVKMVLRTELLKPLVPMPTFDGEKNFNPVYLFLKVDPWLDYIIINENLCNVEYQTSGMSANIYRQFRNSPKSFAEIRKVKLNHPRVGIITKFKDAAHLVSSAIFAKDIKVMKGYYISWLIALAVPLGIALNLFIRLQTIGYKVKH